MQTHHRISLDFHDAFTGQFIDFKTVVVCQLPFISWFFAFAVLVPDAFVNTHTQSCSLSASNLLFSVTPGITEWYPGRASTLSVRSWGNSFPKCPNRRLPENRTVQSDKRFYDLTGASPKHQWDCSRQTIICTHFSCTKGIHCDHHRLCHSDCVSQRHLTSACKSGSYHIFSNISCHICCRSILLLNNPS